MKKNDGIQGFAIWHPVHGFQQPHHYEGRLACVRTEDFFEEIKELNDDAGQTTRTGWRVVPITITRDAAAEEDRVAVMAQAESCLTHLTQIDVMLALMVGAMGDEKPEEPLL